PSESEEDPDSEDEYVAEPEAAKGRGKSSKVLLSDSDESDTHDAKESSRKGGVPSQGLSDRKASPASTTHHKRRLTATSQAPAAKRKRSSDVPVTVEDDPARKYCLGKLQEMFCPIFLRYPHTDASDGSGNKVELKPEDVTDEVKQQLDNEAKAFASELEQSIFDIYAEPDKHGKQSVGSKYKERFRMLTFNLSQADRVAIHRRICYATISGKELAVMSSTDLANEETKQSIKMAEQESLEHSILQKTTVPRAKITHKGLQDIEDVNGETAALVREREKEREKEEDERRERERQARLRAAEQHQKQRANLVSLDSVPPDSPLVAQTPTWGGPPLIPLHAMPAESYSPTASTNERPPIHSIFTSVSDYHIPLPEPELDIADLIHLDEEPSRDATAGGPSTSTEELTPSSEAITSSEIKSVPMDLSTAPTSEAHASITETPNQAPKPETPVKHAFDLNTLWSAPKEEAAPQDTQQEAPVAESKDHPMEVDTVHQEATDQDFDMFLEKDHETEVEVPNQRPEDPEAVFKAIPTVWHGTIALPLDTPVAEEARVVARQIGGRTLCDDSPLWKTLFTSSVFRIEGRVQTEKAAQFLLQMRLNPQRELIACAFSPEPGDEKFKSFIDFLRKKDRHGLVFPWGQHPKDYHPGRELYMVPLLANMPLPDYMELLDNLRLPKTRISDIFVGIWILMKGKLAPPPAPQPQPPPPIIPSLPPVSAEPGPQTHMGLTPSLLPEFRALPQLANSALAAEVAALTPEQIQAVLNALSPGNGTSSVANLPIGVASALGSAAGAPLPPPPPHARVPPPSVPPVPPQWNGGIPNFPSFPPNPILVSSYGSQATPPHSMPSPIHQPPGGPSGRGALSQGHYDNHNGDRDFRRGPSYDRGGDRGNWQTGRGRGRGRGWGRGNGSYRPVDSGWGRGRGSSSGHDDRGRADDSPPRQPRRW
ncbi:transcription factor S-II, central domain-containing protein, partial [Scleroderma citrinum]